MKEEEKEFREIIEKALLPWIARTIQRYSCEELTGAFSRVYNTPRWFELEAILASLRRDASNVEIRESLLRKLTPQELMWLYDNFSCERFR